jgi:hypothetical protein
MVTDKTKVTTLNDILATRARAIFPYRVNFQTVGYETLPAMMQWCEFHNGVSAALKISSQSFS